MHSPVFAEGALSAKMKQIKRGAIALMSEIAIKRAYDPPSPSDGFRVLVDRIWPRGVKREEAKIDLWLKDVAPTTDLRKWFGHDSVKWPGFEDRYRAELAGNAGFDELLAIVRQHKQVTLVFAARDTAHNNAVVLQALCKKSLKNV
jgi:uncharacterized protein YeaO (DUF488 family)